MQHFNVPLKAHLKTLPDAFCIVGEVGDTIWQGRKMQEKGKLIWFGGIHFGHFLSSAKLFLPLNARLMKINPVTVATGLKYKNRGFTFWSL